MTAKGRQPARRGARRIPQQCSAHAKHGAQRNPLQVGKHSRSDQTDSQLPQSAGTLKHPFCHLTGWKSGSSISTPLAAVLRSLSSRSTSPATASDATRLVATPGDEPAKCISMHQPWASLLVAGIKTVEGRSWSTSYRGPLWVASTVKKCHAAATDRARAEHAASTGSTAGFPSEFPSASLLGRVIVTDCLERDEWRRRVQRGDLNDEANDSPFLFVCTQPHWLPTPLPVRGMHRIWTLPASIATAATHDLIMSRPRSQRSQPHPTAVADKAARSNSKVESAAAPARAKVRTAFAKALSMDDLTAAAAPPHRASLRAAEVESALFAAQSHTTSDAYKERARALLFNLRDPLNAPLRASIVNGGLSARVFVTLGPDELANPKLQAANKALDAALLAELVLSNSGGCETEGMFMCPKCGGQKAQHFVDYKPQGRKSEVWGTGQGADEDSTTMSRVSLNCLISNVYRDRLSCQGLEIWRQDFAARMTVHPCLYPGASCHRFCGNAQNSATLIACQMYVFAAGDLLQLQARVARVDGAMVWSTAICKNNRPLIA